MAISYHRGHQQGPSGTGSERPSSDFKRPDEEHTPAVQMARNGRSQRPVLVRWLMRGSASGAVIRPPVIRSPKGKIRRRSSKHVTARRPEPSGAHSAACAALGSAIVTTGHARAPILRTSHTCRGIPRSRTSGRHQPCAREGAGVSTDLDGRIRARGSQEPRAPVIIQREGVDLQAMATHRLCANKTSPGVHRAQSPLVRPQPHHRRRTIHRECGPRMVL